MHKVFWSHDFGNFCCNHTLDEPPEDNCPMHTHGFMEIYYFISGNCTYTVEGTAYALKPHDILFKRPLEAHKLTVNASDVPYERIGISLPVDLFQALDPENTLFAPMMTRPLGTGNRFTSADFGHNLCTEMMERLAKNGRDMTQAEIVSVVLFVTAEASRVLRSKTEIKRASDTSTRLIDYVNDHLYGDISLAKVSREFFLSQSQINRIFKANTGSSLGQYVTAKRLLTARDRIRSGIPAAEACYTCGYNDYSSFYRAYVKRFGHTPMTDKKDE
ncbi:MAG: helix-turn-helix domain-containing protein [Clostridia bacterium]|nr:helix-turn-helix domain-containing protein [Clostridia bacterium]